MKAPPCFDDPDTKRSLNKSASSTGLILNCSRICASWSTNGPVLVNDLVWTTKLPEY